MATNLKIDDKLLNEVSKLSHLKTKKATVNQVLAEFVQRLSNDSTVSNFHRLEHSIGTA